MSARQFNSVITDRLTTALISYKGADDNFSGLFWVKSLATAGASLAASVMGATRADDNGIGIRLNQDGSGNTLFQLHNNLSGRAVSPGPLTDAVFLNKVWLLAVVNDVAGNACHFYASSTDTASLAEMVGSPAGTALTFSAVNGTEPAIAIGCRNHKGVFNEPFNGVIDQIAWFYGTALTLAQLKQVAACATNLASSSTRYYQITGASPEVDSSPAADNATVLGTTLVDEICGGSGLTEVRETSLVEILEFKSIEVRVTSSVEIIEYKALSDILLVYPPTGPTVTPPESTGDTETVLSSCIDTI